MTDEPTRARSSGGAFPAAILGIAVLLAVFCAFLYVCDWLLQPNTPEQMCAEAVGLADASGGAAVSISGGAVDATSIGEGSGAWIYREQAFEACLARYANGASFRTRQGWWR